MLPNLDALQLQADARTDPLPTGMNGERTPRKDQSKSPKRTKVRKFKVASPPPDRDTVESRYPLGVRVPLTGTLEELRAIPGLLSATMPTSYWFFSANGFNARVQTVRADVFTALGAVPKDTFDSLSASDAEDFDALGVIAELEVQFANKPVDADHRYGCGTYNCFASNVNTQGQEEWQKALRALLVSVNGQPDGSRFKVPDAVAVRAPKMDDTVSLNGATRDARDELTLTLYAAHIGIAPPVLATFPVNVITGKGDTAWHGHGYIMEDGWQDLGDLFKDLLTLQFARVSVKEQAQSISEAIVHLVRHVADHQLLLFDVKPGNMVARRIAGTTKQYEVRMVDFGATFTAHVNLNAHNDLERTSSDCVFFINGLLLINMVLRWHNASAYIFKPLMREVARTWRGLWSLGQGRDLCSLLATNKQQGNAFLGLPNLHRTSEAFYTDALRSTFYMMLENYGLKAVHARAEKHGSGDTSYLGRLVEVMEDVIGKADSP